MKPAVLLSRLSLCLLAVATTVAAQTLQLEPAERVPHPVVDPASDDAQLAIKRFSLPPGLKATLWAAEPMLANPVAFDFDERGRLFVSETYRYRTSVLDIRDYMGMLELDLAARTIEDRSAIIHKVFGDQAKEFAIESEVVRLVEDTDGDGVADKSSIYADGFDSELDGIASGVLARHGKVWFTNIPSLWMLEGDAGDVKKTELLRGFGVRFNFTGHDFHGLAIGHDGKLYYSIGDRGATVTTKEGKVISVPDEGAVFRSNFDGTEFEVVHRGLRNPQELVFDEHGNLFTGDNDSDQGDQERLVYVVEGGDSGWRVGYQHSPLGRGGPWMSEQLWKPEFPGRPAYLLPPVCNIEDGPSGLTYYPGTGLTPEYQGHFFITHFKGSIARSGIQTYTVKERGASFVPTSSQQFIGGVLPTDVTFGPDGVFYLLDWVDGWPKSNKGRVYAIKPEKPDPAQVKISADLAKLLREDFSQKSRKELVALLAHPDRRARIEAQFALAWGEKTSLADFTKVAANAKSAKLARLHAIWGMTMWARKANAGDKALAPLAKLLGDGDAEVRAQAARSIGDLNLAGGRDALAKALRDPAPRVQFFAAQSLGKLGDAAAAEPLIALLRANDNQDAHLRFAAANALSKLDAPQVLAAGAKDASAAVRLGVLLAYRYSQNPAVSVFLEDNDPYIVREAALAINDAQIDGAMASLAGKLASAPADDEPLVLRALNANYRVGGSAHAQALASYALDQTARPEMRTEALTQLSLWGKVPQRDRVVGVYRPMQVRDATDAATALAPDVAKLLGTGTPEPVQLAAIEAVRSLGLASATPALAATVADAQAPEAVRVAALRALDAVDAERVLASVAVAEKSSAPGLRLAALQIVASRAPQRALPVIRRFAASDSEVEQQAAFQAMAELQDAQAAPLLVSALDRLAAGKVKPRAQMDLFEAVQKNNAPTVKARWEKQEAAWASGNDALAPYRYALDGGDPWRGGQEFFNNAVLPCARCHRAFGQGGEAGPDLSRIGAQQTPEYLLESIVKPSAHIAPGFDNVTFTLANGETETGSVVSENAKEVVLKRGDGSEVTLELAQVKDRVVAPSSMPEVYQQIFTRAQMRDVVAFLKILDGSRAPGGAEETFGTSNRAMQSAPKEGEAGGHP